MKNIIVGIGSALVDILAHETDDFLHKSGAVKGSMTLVDDAIIENILSELKTSPSIVPGGSACNTMIGIARLGGASRFVGKRGTGSMGAFFETGLIENGVEPHLLHSPSRNGRVLSIITPDAQRSMLTYLGASSEIRPEDIADACFEGAAVVHFEGYLLFNPTLMLQSLSLAKKTGARISLDLSSFTVVESNKALLDQIVDEFIDILIANEDEARAFTGQIRRTSYDREPFLPGRNCRSEGRQSRQLYFSPGKDAPGRACRRWLRRGHHRCRRSVGIRIPVWPCQWIFLGKKRHTGIDLWL